jgi:alpha-tubulin suppressor-like RCC1 family protein
MRAFVMVAVACVSLVSGCSKGESTPACAGRACVRVAALRVADGYGCALIDDGTAKCWGYNAWGQLGDGTFVNAETPVDVKNLAGATLLTAGGDHSCALRPGGAVWCWGGNDLGQLGDGTTTDRPEPVFAVTVAGATRLAAGSSSNCALADGAVRCWGYNGQGQLGNGTITLTPVRDPVTVSGITDATDVVGGLGGDFNCAVVTAGKVGERRPGLRPERRGRHRDRGGWGPRLRGVAR